MGLVEVLIAHVLDVFWSSCCVVHDHVKIHGEFEIVWREADLVITGLVGQYHIHRDPVFTIRGG